MAIHDFDVRDGPSLFPNTPGNLPRKLIQNKHNFGKPQPLIPADIAVGINIHRQHRTAYDLKGKDCVDQIDSAAVIDIAIGGNPQPSIGIGCRLNTGCAIEVGVGSIRIDNCNQGQIP